MDLDSTEISMAQDLIMSASEDSMTSDDSSDVAKIILIIMILF